jgi:hypothetical protein
MRLGGNIYIAREPEAVFDAVADHWIDFGPIHEKIEPLTEGPYGAGSKFLLWKRDTPIGTETYAVWDPPHRLVRELHMGGLDARDETRLQPYEGGTLVDYCFETGKASWWIRPFFVIAWWRGRREVAKGLGQLKRHLEASG